MCVCVCVCVCDSGRVRARGLKKEILLSCITVWQGGGARVIIARFGVSDSVFILTGV